MKKRAAKKVHFIPKGYHSVTPYLACRDAAAAIEFYKKAFGATERLRMPAPGGKIGHAEVQIGDSCVMLADEYPEMDFLSPPSRGGSTVTLHVYVEDVDAMVERAVAAGARLIREVKDQFYGDRTGSLQDPFGHVWHLATHIENLSEAEMKKRGRTGTEALVAMSKRRLAVRLRVPLNFQETCHASPALPALRRPLRGSARVLPPGARRRSPGDAAL